MEIERINKKPTIGAALIVKNEAENISACLESIENICSQIVVVDTGSDDNTPQICSRFGAEVYFCKWNGSFSDARNYGLSLMRTDWIIAIDADEWLEMELSEDIYNLLGDGKTGGINIKIISKLKDGTSATHRYTRLFRRDDAIRYSGRIHEQIRESIENAGFKIVDTDDIYSDSVYSNKIDSDSINSNKVSSNKVNSNEVSSDKIKSEVVIHHKGYINTSEKITRNRDIISDELAINPDDDYLKFHLAETEFSSGNFDVAKELFSEISRQGNLSGRQEEISRIRLAQIGLSENKTELIEGHLDFESEDIELEGLRQYVLAAYYISEKKYDIAYDIFKNGNAGESSLVDNILLDKALAALEGLV